MSLMKIQPHYQTKAKISYFYMYSIYKSWDYRGKIEDKIYIDNPS
jgi:hypothetical protein